MKRNPKILILTEGGKGIGFGHVARNVALCQAFGEKQIYPKLLINGDGSFNNLLESNKYKIFDWLKNPNTTLDFIRKADIVIIDSYLAKIDFYRKVSSLVKIAVYADDYKRMVYPRGIVVNGAISANNIDYPFRKDTVYMLGPKYTALRKEFWYVPQRRVRRRIRSVMMTFGGHGLNDIMIVILKALAEKYPMVTKNIVISNGLQDREKMNGIKDRNTNFIMNPDAEIMKKTMLHSEIAISAGGQTLYELARIGVPTIAVTVADNQINNIKGWTAAGFIKHAGSIMQNSKARIAGNVIANIKLLENESEREYMSSVGRKFVDGQGAGRIVSMILARIGG